MANVISIRIDADGKAAIVETKRTTDEMSRELGKTVAPVDLLTGAFNKLGPAAVAAVAGFSTAAMVDQLHQAGMAAARLRNSFEAAAGSISKGTAEQAYARAEVHRLGLDLLSTSTSYMKLTASAKGTFLEGEKTRDIFKSVTGASRALELSAEETNGALYAITQMMSKGTVQSEELRGQLGERLPGAFNIAARAMGVTTAQLSKMLENGEVISDDFLPKFAAELEKTFPPGEKAMQGMTAETARLKTAWFELKTTVMTNGGESMFTDAIRGMKSLVVEADSFYARMTGAMALLKGFVKNPMDPTLGGSPQKNNYAPLNKYDQYLAAPDFSVVGPAGGASSMLGAYDAIFAPSQPIKNPSEADVKAADKASKAGAKATETAAKNARDIEMILQTSAERILLIGKSADEKALLQMDMAHAKQVKSLKDHHASTAQLAQEEANYQLERTTLINEQKLEKARELARAEASIAEKAVADQIAWQQKLSDYQLKTGRISEDEAITRKYEGEAKLMQAKQATLEVQIEQEKNEARRLELEAEYWRLLQQITNLEKTSGVDRSLAADALARSYEEINIRLLEMKGRLEDAAKARIALEWKSPQRQQLAADAATGVPGAEEAYLQQEEIDRRSIRQAGIQQQQPRNQLRNNMQMGIMQAQGQSYDASRVALLQQLDERQQAIEDAYAAEIELENEKNAALLEAQEEYAAQKAALDQATADKALSTMANSLTSIGQTLMQGNKDQFEAGKAMAIAGATIDTFRAATGAYAAMASIPYVGPALGAVAAAAAVVSGMAQIAQIESTQYRGARALGGPVEAGSTYLVGERGPELLTMGSQGGTVTPNSALGAQPQQVRVTNVYQISTGVSDTVRSEIMKAVPAITAHSVAAVGRAINSGGPLSAAVGRM